ncbi:MAG: hypothetical protein HY366_01120 [Candidatus Aenigmarchaeota archaeon]|nr:hypothetical protein [Candidatus Aenigmarchaeota archaeon]
MVSEIADTSDKVLLAAIEQTSRRLQRDYVSLEQVDETLKQIEEEIGQTIYGKRRGDSPREIPQGLYADLAFLEKFMLIKREGDSVATSGIGCLLGDSFLFKAKKL